MPDRYIPLSQGHLNLLAQCPRKFQHIYLDQFASPISPEQQASQQWGTQFHQFMQQHELGLPIEPFLQEDPALNQCFTAFRQAAPEILTPAPDRRAGQFRQSEHQRVLAIGNYLLVAIYDLLIADGTTAQILDWKTYSRPRNQSWLQENWQTRLYPFVLAETSQYASDCISMTYWFIPPPGESGARGPVPQSLQFDGNSRRHEKTRQALTQQLDRLSDWLARYQSNNEAFPQVSEDQGHCLSCPFALRCHRYPNDEDAAREEEILSDLTGIAEIAL